jgi:ATP-binding cassette, subfamily G (WHITE), member 1
MLFRTSKIEGSITVNGQERNLSVFRKLSAYIMQDNQLHSNLTVEEAMNVAANLKLSQNVQRGEKMSVVSLNKSISGFPCV